MRRGAGMLRHGAEARSYQAWPGRTKLAFLFLNVLLENLFQKWNIPELGLAGLS